MNMMQFPQNFRLSASFQHIEQVEDGRLHDMLRQADKTALIAKLNSERFSQKTLHSLLHKASSEEGADVVVMMLKTRSYATDVLANIIVDTLNNDCGENAQEGFVSQLLKDESLKIKILTTALDIAAKKATNLPLRERLIKLAALSAYEKEHIAIACPHIDEFFSSEQLGQENLCHLSNNQLVMDESEVIEEVGVKTMESFSFPLMEQGPIAYLAHEIKMEIAQFLEFRDLLRYAQINQDFNKAMQEVLRDRTTPVEVIDLTTSVMGILGKVKCLDLRFSYRVTDTQMHHIGQLNNLRALDLGGAQVTEAGLQHLANLTCLQKLCLRETPITDAGLQHLANLTGLQTLCLRETSITDAGMPNLEKLTKLQTLHLIETYVTHAGLNHLEKLTHLHTLNLCTTNVRDAGLQHIEKLANLQDLNLCATNITDAGLYYLEKLTHLHTLNLCATNVTDAGLPHLEKLTRLHTLDLGHTYVTGVGLQRLGKLTHLHTLKLNLTTLTDAGLQFLEKLPNLHTLELTATPVEDFDRCQLEKLARLLTLDLRVGLELAGPGFGDYALSHLKKLTDLHTLTLSGSAITDAGLYYLEKLVNLHALRLDETAVTDAGLIHLRKLINLRTLDLDLTAITDAGLPHLEKLIHLDTLRLWGTKVTASGLDRLEKLLPDITIYW